MLRVLITGGAGHVGSHLVGYYRERGYEVVDVDVRRPCTMIADLENENGIRDVEDRGMFDIVINNAKLYKWEAAERLGRLATTCIINVGSIYGALGPDPKIYNGTEVLMTPPWYAAAKGAMIALTRFQATTWAPVRSNCVCPGGIFRDHDPQFVENYCARVPLKRMATEEDVVNAITWLASDESSYITGQVLMVDGGLSAW